MPVLAVTEIAAWALIAGGFGYAALASRGVALATMAAGLAAIAAKTVLLNPA
ncbi:hypothetical protein JMJ55_27170 [Belnapia sp. T6]|uniref:Uncharacterized protein n=1 Tax=Belnapia mucosa TaxID=2804532 RepID=A0ABS1VBG4_9PROT|nr:hypothetical protein [Belnapia mucosa]MBL6459016.1 hypothetical protein [Belnapia mucosa]